MVENIRDRCPHFRILVMGKSNAGKTTILKKVCNSVEDPMIFSPSGKQIDTSVVTPSAERGEHNIENEMIFKSNTGFIFHDSRGFESGSVDETETVRKFLSKRAQAGEMKDQVHAVWYCLPTDAARPILAADEMFFNGCGIGKAPVIVIFTKFDGLVTKALTELRSGNGSLSFREALKRAPAEAEIKLDTLYKQRLQASKFPPTACLHLKGESDMQRGSTTCPELIEATANAITDDALKGLFLSVQQSNINLCIHYALSHA
ncbi:GTP-binding protein [Athelia psychrophila]|uniref:GTP-binding protein n=1 Tax=Athelia psychrophila TaxID=1759441 RepID=A0A166QDN0_9AGAM|nr:GTP-binding protein [Fibularhizoctonia sp. CBS 109695]